MTIKRQILLWFLLVGIQATAAETMHKVLILDTESTIDNPIWRESLVGFGVKNQLRALLQERLSHAEILDEKTLDASSDNGNNLHFVNREAPKWLVNGNSADITSLQELCQKYGISSIFWVNVLNFSKPKSRLSVGLWSSQSERSELNLEVCRYTNHDLKYRCSKGVGSSTKNLDAFIYQPIEDSGQNQPHFDQSAVGQISFEALTTAVTEFID